MSGPAQVFYHRGHRGHREFWWEGADSRSVGMARCWGWYRVFFTTKTQRAQRFLWWEGADSRSVGMALCRGWYRFFFTTEAQRAQRFFVVGRRRLERGESGGNGALLGLVGGCFTTEDTEGTEIFGKSAPIRGQWEWRIVGGGRCFFSPQRTQPHLKTREFRRGDPWVARSIPHSVRSVPLW